MIRVLVGALIASLSANLASAQESRPAQLKCEVGPVTKTYGKSPWLVYSCNDNRSVVFLAGPGNRAAPFYFIMYPDAQGYRIEGEGTGDKAITDAAAADLKLLAKHEIEALIELTKHP
jgi:hypothetical protein